jgi:hypothetical protein
MTRDSGSGIPSYQGYEYQILATVWVALDLIVRRKVCDQILVEPVSDEDIAAELHVEPEDATSTLAIPAPDGLPIEVQIKMRGSQWTESTFAKVLADEGEKKSKKGPARRSRAVDSLQNTPRKQYTLLTNAQLQAELRPFIVDAIGEESRATTLPRDLQTADIAGVAKRIGIMSEKKPELLRYEIEEILRRLTHVPWTRVSDCASALEQEVRLRLLGKAPQEWAKGQIEAVIVRFDGFPERRAPAPLVPPRQYGELRTQLVRGVLLLTGPAGSGKTHVAEHLADECRREEDSFHVIEIHSRDGVGVIRQHLHEQGRHLFFIHDPWGQFAASDEAQEWAAELPKLVRDGSAEKRFLVTSRVAIKEEFFGGGEANALLLAERRLTEEDYYREDRLKVLDLAMAQGTPRQKDFVTKHRDRIVDRLRLPYALDLLAQAVRSHAMEPELDIEKLIEQSNVNVIGKRVSEEITARGRDAVAATVPLWVLLMTQPAVSVQDVANARRLIRGGGFQSHLDPEKLLDFLERGGWLVSHHSGGGLIAHPTVLEGLERAVATEPALTEEVLTAYLRGLNNEGQLEFAKVIARQLRKRQTPIPRAIQDSLNRYLLTQVGETTGYDCNRAFNDLVELSDAKDPATQLAGILATPRHRHRFLNTPLWKPPSLQAAEIQAIRDSGEAREVARKFTRHVLLETDGHTYRARDLSSFFSQFGWDLSEEFFAALVESLGRGSGSAEVFAEGALMSGAPRYDQVINIALKDLDATREWFDGYSEEYRKADQAELDADQAGYIHDEPSDRFHPAESVLQTAVAMRRAAEGYAWIPKHPRSDDLVEGWAKTIGSGASSEELGALLTASSERTRGYAWQAVAKSGNHDLLTEVLSAIEKGPIAELPDVLQAFGKLAPSAEWGERLQAAVVGSNFARKAAIVRAVRYFHLFDDEERIAQLETTLLGSDGRRAFLACRAVIDNPVLPRETLDGLKAPERKYLSELTQTPDDTTAAQAAVVLANLGEPVLIFERLINSTDEYVRCLALHLAGSAAIPSGRDYIRKALNDQDYRCRRAAIHLLASDADIDERRLIIAKATDPSAPVRESCVHAIGEFRWAEGQGVLCQLLFDSRNANPASETLFRHASPVLHVARAAARSLCRFDALSPEALEKVVSFVKSDGRGCRDLVVHARLIDLLGYEGGTSVLPLLLDLTRDKRHMSGLSNEGFPLRFAEMRGVVLKLLSHPECRDRVKVEVFLDGARHDDGRIAGPSLMALGLLGPRAYAHYSSVLASHPDAAERALILLTASKVANPAAHSPDVSAFLPADHPGRMLVSLAANSPPVDDAGWKTWLAANPATEDWLKGIQAADGINPILRFAANLLFGEQLDHLLEYRDMHQNDFAESVPVMTTRSLFGGE